MADQSLQMGIDAAEAMEAAERDASELGSRKRERRRRELHPAPNIVLCIS